MTLGLRASFITPAVAALSVALASATGAAQEVGARRGGTGVTSPEVAEDRRVTFRLRAPEARAVTVSGDFGNDVEMRRSADGIWTASVGPLDPEMYVYSFTVDVCTRRSSRAASSTRTSKPMAHITGGSGGAISAISPPAVQVGGPAAAMNWRDADRRPYQLT